MYYRRPTRTNKPAPAPPPLPEAMVDEFRDRPFGSVGETSVVRPAEPPAPAPEPFVIEPPPWATDPAPYLTPPAEPAPLRPAIEELMATALTLGELEEPPPPPGPAVRLPPLQRPKIPEWPEEERLRERLAREREQLGIHEEEPGVHPPPRRETA